MSLEDAFTADPNGAADGRCPSFMATFGSFRWFMLPDGTGPQDVKSFGVEFDGVDIIPSTYTVPTVQYGSELGNFFQTPYDGKEITGLQRFLLLDADWYARYGHNVKAKLRAGNAPGYV